MLYTDKTSFVPYINNSLLSKKYRRSRRKRKRQGGAYGREAWGQPALATRRGRGYKRGGIFPIVPLALGAMQALGSLTKL